MANVRLTYFVATQVDADQVEGAAYATGGWVIVERLPFWVELDEPVIVVATWAKDNAQRVRFSMATFLAPRIKPI